MNYQQAKQKVLSVPWKTDICHSGENCWCRIIRPTETPEYIRKSNGEPHVLDSIIDYGSVDKETAEYIVNLHNSFLDKKLPIIHVSQKQSEPRNHEQAQQHSLSVPWKTDVCNVGEDCWCRLILPTEKIEYVHKYSSGEEKTYEIEDIIPDGALDKDIAEYVVDLHNKAIQSTVSKPGAVFEVAAVPIPEIVQAKMAEAIRGGENKK